MFCPKCKSEYVEGITECAECEMQLVEELPPEPEEVVEYENFVRLKTYHTRHEAEFSKSVLDANGIESFIASDDAGSIPGLAFSRGVYLSVHQADVEKANELFKDLEASQGQEGEGEKGEEEDAQTQD